MNPIDMITQQILISRGKRGAFPPVPVTQQTPATRPVPPGLRNFSPIPPPPPIAAPSGTTSPEVTTAYPSGSGIVPPPAQRFRPMPPQGVPTDMQMAPLADDPFRYMAPGPSAAPVPVPRPRPAAAPVPAPAAAPADDLNWFQRNAFRQRDRESGAYLDPTLAARAGG